MPVEKQLRRTLEQELNVDLSGHKALIRSEVSFTPSTKCLLHQRLTDQPWQPHLAHQVLLTADRELP